MQFCPNCGLMQQPGAQHCPKCGVLLPPVATPAPAPQPAAAQPAYLPAQKEPSKEEDSLGTGGYLFTLLVSFVPVVGLILLLVWGCSRRTEPARRDLSRAILIIKFICAVFIILLALAGALLFSFYVNSGDAAPYYYGPYTW